MKKPICSNKHFERLLKQFKKIAVKQMRNNQHVDNKIISNIFIDMEDCDYSIFDVFYNSLLKSFKTNPYKTHSSYNYIVYVEKTDAGGGILKHVSIDDYIPYYYYWMSFTVEDDDKKRVKTIDSYNRNLVFKLYFKTPKYKKKRIARWSIPMTWHNYIHTF